MDIPANASFHFAFHRFKGRIDHLHRDGFGGLPVIRMAQFGFHKGMAERHIARGVQIDAAPDAGVAVADTVHEGEVPADAHQHGGVQPDVAVAAVVELLECAPVLLFPGAGDIHRYHLHRQGRLLARFHKVGDVDVILHEHPVDGAEQVAVHPNLRMVVDAVELEPDLLSGIVGGNLKFGAEPAGVVVAPHLRNVRNQTLLHLVVQAIVGFRHLAVIYVGVQHRAGHDGGQPAFGGKAGERHRLRFLLQFALRQGQPFLFPVMAYFGIQAEAALRLGGAEQHRQQQGGNSAQKVG